ncbi:MAG: MFS transporter [Pseudonocardiales bacterium]
MTATVQHSGAAAPESVFRGAYRATTVGVVIVVTLVAFEAMAVATAMPFAVRDLHGLAYYSWPFTAFFVSSVVGIVTSGDTADRIGPTRPVIAGLVVFLAGLLVAGTAPGMAVFVAGRAVQGFGAGVVVVALYVMIGHAYHDAVRPKVFAAVSAAWVLPSVLGPALAGLVTEHLNWRWVFLGIAPLIVVGAALLVPTLRRLVPDPAGRPGAAARALWSAAAAAGILLLQYAGQRPRWVSLAMVAAGLALLAPALRRLLPAGTMRLRRGLPAVVAFRGMLGGAFFGAEAFLPLTLTTVHGFRPSQAGLPLTLTAVGWTAGSWWQGRQGSGERHRLIRTGFVAVALAVLGLAVVAQPAVNGWLAAPVWMAAGVGMGLAMSTISVLVLRFAPPGQQGFASSALQISDVLSASLCVGLGGVVLGLVARAGGSMSAGVVVVNGLLAAFAVTGAIFAGRARAPRG